MSASESQPITREELRQELASFKAEILDAISRAIDPVALARRSAADDPVPVAPDTLAELDAALTDETPGVLYISGIDNRGESY